MKKNIFTIIITALCAVNLILTAVVLFAAVPTMKQTSNLIKQVSQAVDLELEASEANEKAQVTVKDRENHEFKNSAGTTITINLKKGNDGKEHWAQVDAVYVTVNKASEDYEDMVTILDEKSSDVIDIATDVIGSYDYDKLTSSKGEMKNEMVKKLQEFFDSNFIIDVSFDNLRFQ